jgi:crossover junction endodeoxyribonuclease RusA
MGREMTDTTYQITLPWPSTKLNANARNHWRVHADAKRAYRKAAWELGLEAKLPKMPEARLVFTYHPPDHRHRDAQNLPGMLKSAIDGLADAMGVDDRHFRCAFAERFSEVRKGGSVVVTISAPIAVVPVTGTIS